MGKEPSEAANASQRADMGIFSFGRVEPGEEISACGVDINPPPRFLRRNRWQGVQVNPAQRTVGTWLARRTSVVRPLEGTVAFMDRDREAVNRENEKGGSATNPILPPRPWYGFPQWRWGRNHIDTHGWRWFGPRASSERRSVGFRLAHLVQRRC